MSTQITSALAYAGGLTTGLSFALLAGNGAAIREQIKAGDHPGISFPVKRKRGPVAKLTDEKKRQTVVSVNNLRNYGTNAQAACDEIGVSYSSYMNWSDRLGIPTPKRRKQG